jgi:uncharacterized C2H2 Zn-finger protein
MPGTQRLLRSLRTLAKKRRALKAVERRLDAEERQVMATISQMLAGVGYRIVARDGVAGIPARAGFRRARKDLKCPRCDRRFAFEMHLARHVNAVHGAKKRATGKRATRKAARRRRAAPATA